MEWLHSVHGLRGYISLQRGTAPQFRVDPGQPLPPGDFEVVELWLDHWKPAEQEDLVLPKIDPADFRKHAATLRGLRLCFLRSLDLSVDDLAFLSQNRDLESLTIENIPGGGDNLIPHLAKLGKLRLLDLNPYEIPGDRLTGRNLGTLACLPKLRRAYFMGSDLDDAAVSMLAERCLNLRDLGLAQTRITDAALRTLSGRALHELRLDNLLDLTDAGLEQLARIPSLDELFIGGVENLTDAGVAAFQRAHPECKIDR